MSNWQRIDTNIVYQNPYLTVHEDNVITPQGKPTKYGWVETPPSVYIVAIESNGKVVIIKQLRYTTGQPSWELPAARADGEDALDAGKRQLEAVGLHADKWVSLSGEYYVWNSLATQRNTVLIARDLHKVKNSGSAPASEAVVDAVHAFSWSELKEMMKSGEFNDSQSVTALTLAGLHLGHIA